MLYSKIANMFQTRYLFSKAHEEVNKNKSKRREEMLYKKITHNPLFPFL